MSSQPKTQEIPEIKPRQKFEGHTHWVTGIIHLPGGQRMMTCSYDGSLRVWNSHSGKQIGNNWRNGEGVNAIALSPDGTKVVCGTSDSGVLLWNIDTEKVIWTGQHAGCIECVCWNRDGGRVVSGSSDRTARVWDVESGKTVLEIETGLRHVWAMICSPDTTMIAIGGSTENSDSEDKSLEIWDANTGKFITNIKGSTEDVYCLAWTANGKMLISGSIDSSIRTWSTTTWQQINVFTRHTSCVSGIALSPKGRILASISWDETVQLWDLENSQPIGMPLQHPDEVECMSFSTDGKLLATGCSSGNAYSWDIAPIVREAGLDELLLSPNDGDKSLLNRDATRHPRQRRDVHLIPEKFFDDSPRLPHPSTRNHPSPSSAHPHRVAGSSRLRFLVWARHPLSVSPRRQNDERIELQGHRPTVVEVPFTRGQPRNVSAAEVRRKQEKAEAAKIAKKAKEKEIARNAKTTRNASAGSSQLPQGSLTQQSGGAAQTQPSSGHIAIPTSSTVPSPGTARYTLFKFWPAACCTSAQHTDGHH